MADTAYLTVYDEKHSQVIKKIQLSPITFFSEDWTISCSSIPIPTKKSEETYVMDTGVKERISIHIRRPNPSVPYLPQDSSTWSNARWLASLRSIVNRWQMDSDGCRFTYIPENPQTYRSVNVNAYISTLDDEYSTDDGVEVVTARISLSVGGYKYNYSETVRPPKDLQIPDSGDGSEKTPYLFDAVMGDRLEWGHKLGIVYTQPGAVISIRVVDTKYGQITDCPITPSGTEQLTVTPIGFGISVGGAWYENHGMQVGFYNIVMKGTLNAVPHTTYKVFMVENNQDTSQNREAVYVHIGSGDSI